MAAKLSKIKIKINITICVFSTLELSSNLGKQYDVNKGEKEISKRNQTSIK